VPETVGRGGLLIHPAVDGVTDGTLYTDREHLVTYPLGDFDEMLRLVDHYLEHETEREAIRAAGRAHVAAHHTYRHRMEAVLAAVPALADA
jgi:spore maturation protein CgeB